MLRGWREVIPFRQDTAFNDFPTMLVALKRQLSFQSRREIPAGGKGTYLFFFFFSAAVLFVTNTKENSGSRQNEYGACRLYCCLCVHNEPLLPLGQCWGGEKNSLFIIPCK